MLKGDRGSPISSHVSRQSGEGMDCREVSAVKADSVDDCMMGSRRTGEV